MRLYIIMPVVNCWDITKQALDSIQCKTPYTVVLIDNASKDDTEKLAKELVGPFHDITEGNINRFIYIRNDPGFGVSQSWNQGIKLAFEDPECVYVAVLNNDIILHPKTLDHLIAYATATNYLMVTADNIQSRMSQEVMLTMELPEPYTDFDMWPIEGWRAEGPDFSCYMISRDTIRVIGWFDENFKGAYCEDWDYHARISRARDHITKHQDQGIPATRVHAKRLSTAPYFHLASQTIQRNPQLKEAISKQHSLNQEYYYKKWGGDHPWVMDGNGNTQPFGDATKNWRDW